MGTTEEAMISERIRTLLEDRSISEAELARRLKLSQSYVSRRMRSVVPWRAADLAKIAAVLDTPLSALLPSEQTAA